MSIKKCSKVLLPVLAMLWGGESFALGLGVTSGSADEDWTNNNFPSSTGNRETSNFGFVLDSNVAKDKLFNYRFSLTQEENKSKNGGSTKFEGIAMTHDFGFALFRNEHVRLWLGPRINASFYDTVKVSGVDTGGSAFGFSYGPVLGVNVHVKDIVSFSFTTGILKGGIVGDKYSDTSTSTNDIDNDIDSRFTNLSVIFRLRDKY